MILMNQLLSGCLIVSQLYYIEFSFIARYLYESFWNLLVGECFVTLRLRVTLLLERWLCVTSGTGDTADTVSPPTGGPQPRGTSIGRANSRGRSCQGRPHPRSRQQGCRWRHRQGCQESGQVEPAEAEVSRGLFVRVKIMLHMRSDGVGDILQDVVKSFP